MVNQIWVVASQTWSNPHCFFFLSVSELLAKHVDKPPVFDRRSKSVGILASCEKECRKTIAHFHVDEKKKCHVAAHLSSFVIIFEKRALLCHCALMGNEWRWMRKSESVSIRALGGLTEGNWEYIPLNINITHRLELPSDWTGRLFKPL